MSAREIFVFRVTLVDLRRLLMMESLGGATSLFRKERLWRIDAGFKELFLSVSCSAVIPELLRSAVDDL